MTATAIRNHTQLLNYLVEKYNLKSYLEIGTQRSENNFIKINADFKVGVDPEPVTIVDGIVKMKSDDYFKSRDENKIHQRTFDLVFIDGLHHADQVKRDFENSLRCLNDGGFIVIHDTLPEDESTTHVPRDSKIWHGDVYKFAMGLGAYDGIKFYTINMDCGCTVVWKEGTSNHARFYATDTSFDNYLACRKQTLRIIQPDEIEKYF